jgi:uncharacterized protein YbjT (DUF2867 family)
VILLVGGTGNLGSRIARRLGEQQLAFRALVRPPTNAAPLEELGAEIVRGDMCRPESLPAALAGVSTVITTANAMSRALAGSGDSVVEVDGKGNENLIEAAEAAGADRFVFLSAAGIDELAVARCPFGAAKLAAERRLRESAMREVILRPEMFDEVWLSASTGFDWEHAKVTVYGKGEAPAAYVSSEDVAELVVRLALADDPPRIVEFGGPETLTRLQAVKLFEQLSGHPIHVRKVPRTALRAGSVLLRRPKPHLASVMAMALSLDVVGGAHSDQGLRDAGIDPVPVGAYARRVVTG